MCFQKGGKKHPQPIRSDVLEIFSVGYQLKQITIIENLRQIAVANQNNGGLPLIRFRVQLGTTNMFGDLLAFLSCRDSNNVLSGKLLQVQLARIRCRDCVNVVLPRVSILQQFLLEISLSRRLSSP